MSGRVRIEWTNVPTSGRRKYAAPRMKMIQAQSEPKLRRRGRALVATVPTAPWRAVADRIAHDRSHRSDRR